MMSQTPGQESQEIELNITPIIDCFTVLITFLLASACFLNIGFFDTEISGSGTRNSGPAPASELIARALGNHRIELQWKGHRKERLRLDLKKTEDRERMRSEMAQIKRSPGFMQQILVTATEKAPYANLAELMDELNISGIPLIVGDFE
jgi:biopolymer transport protein ExbD